MSSFNKSYNPLVSLNVGLITKIHEFLETYVFSYDEYYNNMPLNKSKITINDDLTIDIDDSVVVTNRNSNNIPPDEKIDFDELPYYINFNKINGDFLINDCGINSLRGCPKHVEGSFCCNKNNLTSLEGCPQYVDEDFYCYFNPKVFSKKYIKELCKVEGVIKNKLNLEYNNPVKTSTSQSM